MAKGDMFKKSRSTTRNPMGRGTQMPPGNYGQFGLSSVPAGFGQAQRPTTPVPMAPSFGESGMDRKRVGPLNSFARPNYQFTGHQPFVDMAPASSFVNPPGGGQVRNSPLAITANVKPGVNYLDRNQQNAAMSDLVGRINGLTAQSQMRNPVSAEPTYSGSSMEAGQRAGRIPGLFYSPNTARAANSYGDMNSVTAGQEYARQIPTDMAGMSNRLANQNPMYSGMQRRFAGQLPGLMADQAAVARGEAMNMGGYGEGHTVYFNRTPARTTPQPRPGSGIIRSGPLRGKSYDSPEAKARRAEFAAEKAAKHDAFKAANGGMNYKQARRAEQSQKRQDSLFRQAVMQGENPMSPRAMAMFPEAAGRFRQNMQGGQANQMQNPMAGGRTLEAQQAAAARVAGRETASPHLVGLGVRPGSGLPGLNQGLAARLAEDPNGDFSDESLREFQSHAQDAMVFSTEENNQFNMGEDSTEREVEAGLWRELAGLPDNARVRKAWLDKYKSRSKAASELSGSQGKADTSPKYYPGFTGAFN